MMGLRTCRHVPGAGHGYPRPADLTGVTMAKWPYGMPDRHCARECVDRILIFGESHLRRVLASYAAYYNQARTHLALQKDSPLHRAAQRSGEIVAIPVLAGLHHRYVRI